MRPDSGLQRVGSGVITLLRLAPALQRRQYAFCHVRTCSRCDTGRTRRHAIVASAARVQVRRRADNAREPVREFLTRWKSDSRVIGSRTYGEMSGTLSDLGQYYMKRGQRSAIDRETADKLLARLDVAEGGLPEEEARQGLLGGLFGK